MYNGSKKYLNTYLSKRSCIYCMSYKKYFEISLVLYTIIPESKLMLLLKVYFPLKVRTLYNVHNVFIKYFYKC